MIKVIERATQASDRVENPGMTESNPDEIDNEKRPGN